MTKKSVQSVMNERVLLSQFNSPFIVNIHFAFHDRDTLYLVLDLMEGGDLRYHIGNRVFNEIQSSTRCAK
jgi:serum/glucocorticoid-regulated kinase 2